MQKLEESTAIQVAAQPVSLPVSVIVPVRNEAVNLPRCLESLRGMDEIYVIDSQSTDDTADSHALSAPKWSSSVTPGDGPRNASGRWNRFPSP